MKFIFFNYSFRTGEEKKVFVNAIKEAKKLNKLSSSIPVLGKNQHYRRTNSTGPITETKDGSNDKKPRLKKKPSFGKKDNKNLQILQLVYRVLACKGLVVNSLQNRNNLLYIG